MKKYLILLSIFVFIGCSEEDSCKNVNCGGKGACVIENDKAVCNCFDGYYSEGLSCLEISCTENSCTEPNKNICNITDNKIECLCNKNYKLNGNICELTCMEDSCPIENRNICTIFNNNLQCSCKEGYHLADNICKKDCTENSCAENEFCENKVCIFNVCTTMNCGKGDCVFEKEDSEIKTFHCKCYENSVYIDSYKICVPTCNGYSEECTEFGKTTEFKECNIEKAHCDIECKGEGSCKEGNVCDNGSCEKYED